MASFRRERRLGPVTGGPGALRERLAAMPDDELLARAPAEAYAGWGASATIAVDGAPVFLKRLRLTDVELAHPGSTRNRFRLPTFYSYGVGSAGFTAWRELAAHELTSGLAGFPALLHHRVLPRTATPRTLPFTDDEYVAYWRGSASVRGYMAARRAATHEVWVVLEHVPESGMQWLVANGDAVDALLGGVFEAVATLRALGVVHFDAHLANVVTDGTRFLLTDFGLAAADAFELSATERRFLDRHRHYDAGTVLASLGQLYMGALGHRDERRLAADIDAIDDAPVAYPPALRAAYRRYKAPIVYMVDHFARLSRPAKRSTYDDAVLRELLRSAGVPA